MFTENEESHLIWFSGVETDQLSFKLTGILCALAIYNNVLVDFPFPLALYKKILNQSLLLEDLNELSPTEARFCSSSNSCFFVKSYGNFHLWIFFLFLWKCVNCGQYEIFRTLCALRFVMFIFRGCWIVVQLQEPLFLRIESLQFREFFFMLEREVSSCKREFINGMPLKCDT